MAKRILFQGDSITDASRDHENPFNMGHGYATLVASALGADHPGAYECLNRGISGNRIVDVYARIKRDFINLQPDYASIYIGVNDTWHEIWERNGVDTDQFEMVYHLMLDEVLAACPGIKLMLVAPFVLEGWATCNDEEHPDRYDCFVADVADKAAAVKRVAEAYQLPLIELQPIFDAACQLAPASHWSGDGVHPTPAGHELIKRAWLDTFATMV